jgi:hypothetical protein
MAKMRILMFFEIMNVEWILENSMLRKIRILEVAKMAANYL